MRRFEFRTTDIAKREWNLFEDLLLQTALIEPAILDIVTRILLTYKKNLTSCSKKKIKVLVEKTIENHSQMNHDFEVSWSLWIAKTFSIELEEDIVSSVLEMQNAISLLILLDIAKTTRVSARKIRSILW